MTDLERFVERMKEAAGDTWVDPTKGEVLVRHTDHLVWTRDGRSVHVLADRSGDVSVFCVRVHLDQPAKPASMWPTCASPEYLCQWLRGDLRIWSTD